MWGCTINVFLALFRASRWRRAYKCKTLIRELMSTLKIQRRRRECMVRQSQADIDLLRRNGQLRQALCRAQQIYADECRLSAYDQIECSCKCILENFSELKHQSDVHHMADEVKEAVACLIFAASRVGELPELQSVRYLFRKRFGRDFDSDSVELRLGNAVGSQIRKSLEVKAKVQCKATSEKLMEIANNDQIKTPEAASDSAMACCSDDNPIEKTKVEKNDKMKMAISVRVWLERANEKRKMRPKKGNLQHVHPNHLEYEQGRS